MPIYEYQCEGCGHKLEVMQRLSDDPLKTCPECSADRLRKLISAAGFQLKGTGWYETDFKHNGKPKPKKDGEDKPAAGKGESGKAAQDTKTSDAKTSEAAGGKSQPSASAK